MPTEIGNTIVRLRKRVRLTQAQLADRAGLHGGAIARLELYSLPPGPRNLARLADYARQIGQVDIADEFDRDLFDRYGLISPGRLSAALAAKATFSVSATSFTLPLRK